MKALNKDVVFFLASLIMGGLFPLAIFGADFYFKADQEVQFHDSYFVFRPLEFAIVTVGLVLFLVFLARAVSTKFKNKLTLAFLATGTIVLGLVVIEIFEIVNSLN